MKWTNSGTALPSVYCRHKVRRLMRQNGLRAIQPRSFVPRTTDSRATRKPAENLLLQGQARPSAPNRVLVGDPAYLPLKSGKWAYLATWQDAFSRKSVGWAMAKTMHKELVVKALEKAAGNQRLSSGLIMHSDQGSQYNSGSFKELLRKHGFRQSMARKDEVLDKGMAESFFSQFKAELLAIQRAVRRAILRRNKKTLLLKGALGLG